MFNPINLAFKNAKEKKRPALLTYTVAGDNTKKKSLEILKSISKDVDICEIGFPHNTPIADGGQIQTSAYRALKNGLKISDVFQIVRDFKKSKNSKPVILMGYYNMIYQYGENNFIKKCKSSGVNGLIVVDLPWPENKGFAKKCKSKAISFVQLLSPTTSKERLKKIIKDSHDMIYYISMLSTTGGKLKVSPKQILNNSIAVKKDPPPPGYYIHEVGGAPMGNDREKSVVDNWNRLWECKNVLVVDGSCWPTSSWQSPTLTMMAITKRACEKAIIDLKG